VLALVLSTGAWAQSSSRQSAPPEQGAQENSQLPESVRRVEQQTGGEVLRAEPMQHDGREVYRLKVLTSDGRVRVMQDDPQQRRGSPRQDSQRQDNSRLDNSRQDGQRQNTQRLDSSRRESSQRPGSRRTPPRGSAEQGDESPPEF
jgi:hypothetical protein